MWSSGSVSAACRMLGTIHQRVLLGLVTLAALAFANAEASEGAEAAQAEMAYRSAPLWGGMHLKALDMSEHHRDIKVMVPLPTLPYGPTLAYNHHQYEVRTPMTGVETGGGSRSLLAKLPFGLTLEAGQRLDRFGRRRDDFVGLSFTLTDKRVAPRHAASRSLGVDRGAPMPPHIDAERGLGGFWRIAGSVALLAVLAGGGGGGGSSSASSGGSGGSSPQFSRDSGRTGGTNGDWDLVWEDNFTGTSLDTSKWNTVDSYGRNECFGGGNNEAQCYTSNPENIAVNGGNLVLTALPASGPQEQGRTFTSGRVQSKGKGDFKYGRFEARIQFPDADGAFPAFWMLPTDNVYGFWPRSGEIDIVENANGDARISGAIHYKNPGNAGQTTHIYQYLPNTSVTATDWNTYAVEWHQDEIRWFLNGQPYFSRQRQSWNNGLYPVDPISDHAPFDQDFHLILNLAVKDDALGSGVNINPAHYTGGQEMRVDYVKVYACSAGPNFCQHE